MTDLHKNKLMNKKRIKYILANVLAFVPDKTILRIHYAIKNHRLISFKNPKRFTEYVQCYKAFYRNPEMLRCTDKFHVREYVKEKTGTDIYLNKLYQVCDKAEEINFTKLPQKFVIKTTDGGNGDNIFICKNKDSINIDNVINLINSWRYKRYDIISREWAYKGARKSQIIIEQFLEDDNNKDCSIDDYKFMCYDGKFRFLWVDKGRYTHHLRGFWNENLEFLYNVRSEYPTFDKPPVLPENIDEMIALAEKLSKGFPFARIDLYNIKQRIYFGEITFYPWSGYVKYSPDSFDFELGKYFNLTEIHK